MSNVKGKTGRVIAAALPLAIALISGAAQANPYSETVLHSFNNADGERLYGGIVRDKLGNTYGTAWIGGANNLGDIYKIAPDGTTTVLYSFTGGLDGGNPPNTPILEGNFLYGTTESGGSSGFYGTLYRFNIKTGKMTILFNFTQTSGGFPIGALLRDGSGNFYGTTQKFGADAAGVIFQFSVKAGYKILYSFTNGADGGDPTSDLSLDQAGNVYGVTNSGNSNNGTVFKLTPAGVFTTLYTFPNADLAPSYPNGGLAIDKNGNIYGTYGLGGTDCDGTGRGCGGIFEITAAGRYVALHNFAGTDGAYPISDLRLKGRTLYGTTEGLVSGGTQTTDGGNVWTFSLGKKTLNVLYQFNSSLNDPFFPNGAAPLADSSGNVFGASLYGGTNSDGAVYELSPPAN